MTDALIHKDDLDRWFRSLKKAVGLIWAPKKKETAFVFGTAEDFSEVVLRYIPTILPPKKYFFPPKEELVRFKIKPFEAAPNEEKIAPAILFAAHTCDIAGIQCLDAAFGENPKDAYYLRRREAITIIGLECMDYCDSFASCAAVGAHMPCGGYDIMMTDIGEAYALHIDSKKGEELVVRRGYIRALGASGRAKLEVCREAKRKKFHPEFKSDLKEISAAFAGGFFSPIWEDVGRRCVGCANCTAVCPTCYCFDTTDTVDLSLNEGRRHRVWNYCQMDDFAKVASGEDFRADRAGRQRHRYYRKFQYPAEKFGRLFCTGCGRCSRTCMAGINLVETVNALTETAAAGAAA